MSFLQQSSRILACGSRPMARAFATTPHRRKVVPDAVKEPLKKVDRAVSDAAVAGIEKGQELTGKAKQAAGINADKAEGLAKEAKGYAKEKAGEAQGRAAELKGEAKGKAEEVKHKAS